jgi:UDP-N-acetylmuramoyl-tripeptide--D-alanyl-D-alanine ligase
VTGIGPEHLELMGTVDDVARANAEAVAALPAGGVAIVPADEELLEPYLGRDDIDVRRFSRESVERLATGWRFDVDGHVLDLELPFDQRHMAENVLAALTVYDALGLPLEGAQAGAARIALSAWRSDVCDLPGGGVVVNDAYNANPDSMRAALKALAAVGRGKGPGARTVAVLGEMRELGESSRDEHDAIGRLAVRLDISRLLVVGEAARPMHLGACLEGSWGEESAFVVDNDEATAWLRRHVEPGDVVLLKASRGAALETVADALLEDARAADRLPDDEERETER